MVICIVNPEDSSPSSTNQRPYDEVYQTPRFSSPDPYPYCHARLAASRCLRANDTNRQLLSDIPHLSLPTAVGCQPPVGSALERCKAPGAKRSPPHGTATLVVTLGRKMRAADHLF